MKVGFPFAWDLSLENFADPLCFWLAVLHSESYLFLLYWLSSLSSYTAFDSISSNRDQVLSINAFTNEFIFRDFNVHPKDWLTYSGRTDISSELCYNFSISNKSQTGILTVLLFWIYLFLLTLVLVLQWLSLHWKFWSCCCLSFHSLSIKFIMGCSNSSHSLWLFLCWLGWSSWSFERCSMWGYL